MAREDLTEWVPTSLPVKPSVSVPTASTERRRSVGILVELILVKFFPSKKVKTSHLSDYPG